jgi:hypothetical protein
MADTATNTVIFDGAIGTLVGAEHAYLSRPGFWHGAAGIAVCWFGGATMLANTLRAHLQNNARARNTHALAHLGAIDIALRQASALLSETAAWIDRYPNANAMPAALRVRGAVEATAQSVLEHAGRTLGASAFCKDAAFARMAADLPVFLRQSHAECDLAELGAALLADDITQEPFAWAL